MTTTPYKPHTIEELLAAIFEDNFSHLDFMEKLNGGDCDCHLHQTLWLIMQYWGE